MAELQLVDYGRVKPLSLTDAIAEWQQIDANKQQQKLNEMKMQAGQQEMDYARQAQPLKMRDAELAFQTKQHAAASDIATTIASKLEQMGIDETHPNFQQALEQVSAPYRPVMANITGKPDSGQPMDWNAIKALSGQTPRQKQQQDLQAKIAEKQGLLPFEIAEKQAGYGAQFEKAKNLADYEHNLKIQEKQLEQVKPMPSSIVKEQNESLEAIANLSSTNADLETLKQNLISGKLNLGMFENMGNRIRGAVGGKFANEESRQYADLITSLEKMRNDSLLLNKGTQTEGDAQRAWDQLFKNITDSKYVAERLQEIQSANERAAKIKGENINLMRSEYGKEALDFSKQTSQKSALNKNQSNKYLDEWNKLPSGAIFTTPDGKKVRKP